MTKNLTFFIPFLLIIFYSLGLLGNSSGSGNVESPNLNGNRASVSVSSCIPFPWVNEYFCAVDCDCCQTVLGSPVTFVCNNTQRCVSGNNLRYTCSPSPNPNSNSNPNGNGDSTGMSSENWDANPNRCIPSQKICKPLESSCCSLDEAVFYTCPTYSRCCRTPGFPCSTDCDCCQYDYTSGKGQSHETETETETGQPIPTPAFCNAQRVCEKIPDKVECRSLKMST